MGATQTTLARLIDEWRRAPFLLEIERALGEELAAGTEPFAGRALPDEIVRGRLPEPVRSAWVFVLRPRTRNPAHVHPGSTQHTAVIRGGGRCYSGEQAIALEPFDASRAERTLLVFPPGTPHSFEPGDDPLVVLSFHTVAPEALVEVEVESRAERTYVGRPP